MNHTPTPWRYGYNDNEIDAKGLGTCDVLIAKVYGDTKANREANRRFILRACNAHADLVVVLKALLTLVTDGKLSGNISKKQKGKFIMKQKFGQGKCEICGKNFKKKNSWQKYDKGACKQIAWGRNQAELFQRKKARMAYDGLRYL